MEQNVMHCDTPEALRFFASTARKPEAELMRKAANEIELLRLTPAEQSAITFALGRLSGTLRGNNECDHYDALARLLTK